jgi:hypothetical protein
MSSFLCSLTGSRTIKLGEPAGFLDYFNTPKKLRHTSWQTDIYLHSERLATTIHLRSARLRTDIYLHSERLATTIHLRPRSWPTTFSLHSEPSITLDKWRHQTTLALALALVVCSMAARLAWVENCGGSVAPQFGENFLTIFELQRKWLLASI